MLLLVFIISLIAIAGSGYNWYLAQKNLTLQNNKNTQAIGLIKQIGQDQSYAKLKVALKKIEQAQLKAKTNSS